MRGERRYKEREQGKERTGVQVREGTRGMRGKEQGE